MPKKRSKVVAGEGGGSHEQGHPRSSPSSSSPSSPPPPTKARLILIHLVQPILLMLSLVILSQPVLSGGSSGGRWKLDAEAWGPDLVTRCLVASLPGTLVVQTWFTMRLDDLLGDGGKGSSLASKLEQVSLTTLVWLPVCTMGLDLLQALVMPFPSGSSSYLQFKRQTLLSIHLSLLLLPWIHLSSRRSKGFRRLTPCFTITLIVPLLSSMASLLDSTKTQDMLAFPTPPFVSSYLGLSFANLVFLASSSWKGVGGRIV